jgi:hypothetical protein
MSFRVVSAGECEAWRLTSSGVFTGGSPARAVKECGADCVAVLALENTCASFAAYQSRAKGEVRKLAATVNHPQMRPATTRFSVSSP